MKKIVIGNLKANPAKFAQVEALFKSTRNVSSKMRTVEALLAAPSIFISGLKKYKSMLSAQDISLQSEGAHTGEVTGLMLRDVGVRYVIVGHSERRAKGETNADVSTKIKQAWKSHIVPVVCVGEDARDEKGTFWHALGAQIRETFAGVQKSWLKEIVIAYEPVWAISTSENRKNVMPEEIHEAVLYIRKVLADMYDRKESAKVRVVYGGSVNAKNVEDILEKGNVSGLLVGKASLNAKEFAKILQIANKIK